MGNFNYFSSRDAINLTTKAKTKFDDTASRHTRGDDTGFNSFRSNCKAARATFLAKKATMDEEIKKLNQAKMYSNNFINNKLLELKAEYDAARKETVEKLRAELATVVDTRKSQVDNYTLTPPDDSTMKLLQTMGMRSSIAQTEIEMLISKCCDNFQALSVVHSLAEKNGMLFVMPFDPKEFLEQIDLAEKWCHTFIDAFDKPEGSLTYAETEFYGDYEGTRVDSLFAALDNTTISKDATDILDTLKAQAAEAQKELSEAVETNDGEAARAAARKLTKTNNFIRNNESVMLDEDEKRRRARAEAAKLVAEVIN